MGRAMAQEQGHSGTAAVPSRRPAFRPRVLIVEDEPFAGLDAAMTLQSLGYEALGPCRSIAESEDAIERFRPDAALLDIQLGERATSFALAGRLRDADIPFAFVSGRDPSVTPVPFPLSRVPYLRKPVGPSVLAKQVEALIEAP